MATRAVTFNGPTNESVVVASWTGLLNGDDGSLIRLGKWADKTVQVLGTVGVGGVVQIQGRNLTGGAWGQCHDPQGTLIAIAGDDNDPIVIAESPLEMRPFISAGDGTTDLDVHIVTVAKGT